MGMAAHQEWNPVSTGFCIGTFFPARILTLGNLGQHPNRRWRRFRQPIEVNAVEERVATKRCVVDAVLSTESEAESGPIKHFLSVRIRRVP